MEEATMINDTQKKNLQRSLSEKAVSRPVILPHPFPLIVFVAVANLVDKCD